MATLNLNLSPRSTDNENHAFDLNADLGEDNEPSDGEEEEEVELLLYAPKRPIVDLTAGLLLLMAVGTVVVASLWSQLTDPDQANESYSM